MVIAFSLLVLGYDSVWSYKGRPNWITTARSYELVDSSSRALVETDRSAGRGYARRPPTKADAYLAHEPRSTRPNCLRSRSSWPISPFDPQAPVTGEARSRTCGSTIALSSATTGPYRTAWPARQRLRGGAGERGDLRQSEAADMTGETLAATLDIYCVSGWRMKRQHASAAPWRLLEPARPHAGRHGAILLPWKAALDALSNLRSASAGGADLRTRHEQSRCRGSATMATGAVTPQREPTEKEIRLVIAASSAGTIFEWYDFFIYGTLAGSDRRGLLPQDNETLEILLVWAGFAVGFGFRPLGAILFGFLGDRLGRKYTFLVTVTLMGIATAGVGLIPSAASIGLAAPIIVICLRILQGLALGGEYGGAAIYVAEHAPPEKRGFYTSFIQASVVGGFVLSILVVIACRALIPADDFAEWGWRIPFLLSIVLLFISLWMRLKLSESPVFQAMKAAGETSANPFKESLTYPGNPKRIFVALFGITGVLTTIWYTAFFSGLSFLRGPMRVDEGVVEWMLLIAGTISMSFYVVVGRWSDRVGRKKPIIIGALASLALLFPVFWGSVRLPIPVCRTAPMPRRSP